MTLRIVIAAFIMGLSPDLALAGMPAPLTLTEIARIRIQSLSFFLLMFAIAALGVQLVWNRLGRDFTRLPRLNYPRACGLVGLWGLLFMLVLLMISGARELLTPGAWERDGATYRLVMPPSTRPGEAP